MPRSDLNWRIEPLPEGFYTSEVLTPRLLPVRTFLPTGYEPNYPYPLVVFLHAQGGNEEQILRLAPRLSRRNYICISLRGPEPLASSKPTRPTFGWGQDNQHESLIEDYVFRAVEQTRRNFHVHSERIYLAGVCEGATLAYRLGLTYPEKFGGIISLNGAMPRYNRPLLRLDAVRGLRVWIGHGIANAMTPLSMAREDFRVLYAAGTAIRLLTYATTQRLHPHMLRDVNRWLMANIEQDAGTTSEID
jgi:phospholipase/carboxylesterase